MEQAPARSAAAGGQQSRLPWACPACGQGFGSTATLQRHMAKCCADLVPAQELAQAAPGEGAALRRLLEQAQLQEARLRQAALEAAFLQPQLGEAAGEPEAKGRSPARVGRVARALGVSPARADRVLQRAMRAIPLVLDSDPLQVLYEDEYVLAVNKPAGVNSQPRHRFEGGSMVNRVLGYLAGRSPGLSIHRLDMDTSGVLLFAKDKETCVSLQAQFRDREVTKKYLAVVVNVPAWSACHRIDGSIDRHPTEQVARAVSPAGQPALTSCWCLSAAPAASFAGAAVQRGKLGPDPAGLAGAALVCAAPHTGRTHQIRVHLASVGHPLIGDSIYGVTGPWIARQALHAATLQFTHPRTRQRLEITAPVPPDFQSALEVLGLRMPAEPLPQVQEDTVA